jgi:Ca2+-binding RTX toxin-like protein
MVTRTGGSGADRFIGTAGGDDLRGGGGNDYLEGQGGPDRLIGDSGDDIIYGNAFTYESSWWAAPGHPLYNLIASPYDNDTLGGGAGNDTLLDYYGNNRLDGGDGNDTLESGYGRDTLIGGRGDDYMKGGPGSDVYTPGVGNDIVDDRNGGWFDHDTFAPNYGGNPVDADVFVVERNLGPIGHDVFDGFDPGFDRIEIQGYTSDQVTVQDNRLAFSDGSLLSVWFENAPDDFATILIPNEHFFFV